MSVLLSTDIEIHMYTIHVTLVRAWGLILPTHYINATHVKCKSFFNLKYGDF